MSDYLKTIAEGGGFDVAQAIRELAKAVVQSRQTVASKVAPKAVTEDEDGVIPAILEGDSSSAAKRKAKR